MIPALLKNKLSLIVCWAVLGFFLMITLAGGKWQRHTVIKTDAAGYYVYLPAKFIYNDVLKCKFYLGVDTTYNLADVRYYAVHYYPETEKFYFKYNYGVALFEAPLFFATHALTKLTGQYPADGYSAYYQLGVALSTVIFSFLALLVLRKFLQAYFDDTVIAITLFIIAVGTNFFAQVITQPGLSHIYLFFLYAVVLYATQQWYLQQNYKCAFALAISLGLCLVIRPTDILVAFFPLLWIVGQKDGFSKPLDLLKQHWMKLVSGCIIIFLLAFVQMVYWKTCTGHWYIFTYKYEYFDFTNWQIVNGLFSYRKGWFVYTPLALLGFISTYFLYKNKDLKFYVLPFVLYYVTTLYIVFCWWQWYYGGSFGSRVMVQSIALMALPISALINALLSAKPVVKIISLLIIGLLICLNIFQTAQYAHGVIHWQKMNKEYYWKVFGKWNVSDKEKELLNSTPELTTGNQ
jgi:hypothetical protein